jgi:SH3-like domain-containing protein
MRVSALILLVAGAVVLGSALPAAAEKVKTNQPTKLYAGPGEQKKVLLKVKPGQNMTLLEQEGRWLKVRVNGRTGYVPRSKVDMADDSEIARNTRRRPFVDGRSKRRGFGGEAGPDDRVGADAVGEGKEDSGGSSGDEDDEEDEPKPKKMAAKSKASDDEDEDETPKKKSPKALKASSKSKSDDEDEDEDTPKKPAKASKSKDDDEDEDKPKKASKSDDDEDDAKAKDDEDVDDSKTPEPEEDKRPVAHVQKKVSVFDSPDADSDEKFVARPTDILYPMDEKGKWTEVENEEGDKGWVETEYLDLEGGAVGGAKKRQIDVGARLGLMFIQQGMRSPTSTNLKVPDNYNIQTSAVALSLGAGYAMPVKKKYIVGGELTYDYANTLLGGVHYDIDGPDGPMPAVNTKLTIHNINVRGMAGYDFKKKSGMAIFGRLGFRYQSYLVDGYADPAKNPAKIPQEIVKAPTLGIGFAMPRLTDKLGLSVALDTILIGASITQTKGLEDGGAPTLKAFVFGTGLTYAWKKNMALRATYDLRYMGIDFGLLLATSTRGHMGGDTTRVDFFHMVTFGIDKPF